MQTQAISGPDAVPLRFVMEPPGLARYDAGSILQHLMIKRLLIASTAALLVHLAPVRADEIVTTDGSRLNGTITGLSAGVVTMQTTYAGTLSIKQSLIASIHTDTPLAVRLSSGTRADGKLATTPQGNLQVAAAEGTLSAPIGNVVEIWPAGRPDPAFQNVWSYEVAADIEGAMGNTTSLETGGSFTAQMTGPSERLKFYGNYDRSVAEHVESADLFKAGVDFSDTFAPHASWFARDEAGFDRILGIRFYDTAAAGYGYEAINQPNHLLTFRVGVAYRYNSYEDALTPTVSSAAGDLEIDHDWKATFGELSNTIAVVPDFNDFSNLLLTHDSFFQLPLTTPHLGLRLGVSNTYVSRPTPGIKPLDTLYYVRLVYDFGGTP